MGETYYVRKDYSSAARVFLEAYQKDQKGTKAPDTLLKLGMSLTNLDKKKEACATFDKLGKDFPDASANIKRTLPRERTRAGCA
jgi:TolA-binding protein